MYHLVILLFSIPFGSAPCTKPSYLGKIVLVSKWFRIVLTQMITWVYKDSLTVNQISVLDPYYNVDTNG